ncbi:MAG: prepilin-type family protein, partial [Microcystis panniformis]
QKQAIRRGRSCRINFTDGTGTNPTVYRQITANEAGCLVAISYRANPLIPLENPDERSLSLPQEVFMVVNNFPLQGGIPGVQFSFRGHVSGLTFVPPNGPAIIVLYPAANATTAP